MSIPQPRTPDDDDAYYRAILHDLIDRGADLARQVHEQATPEADPTIAFDRIARTVRRTIDLARRIAAGPARPTRHARTHARAQLIRGVEDAIHTHRRTRTPNGADPGNALEAELAERLQDPELEFDFERRPIPEIIEEICRDLGIATQARSTPGNAEPPPTSQP